MILDRQPERGDVIAALGGGVVHDLAGFLAGTIRRGLLRFLVIPTTLAAMIDAGLSSKTAVNTSRAKNGLGTYTAPFGVLWDPVLLATLDDTALLTGVAELIKIAVVRSPELFEILEVAGPQLVKNRFQWRDAPRVLDAAARCFLRMPFERRGRAGSLRAFGHGGMSRVLESLSRFRMTHGEAVAVEMAIAGTLAHQINGLPLRDLERLHNLIEAVGLPLTCRQARIERLWPVFASRYEQQERFDFVVPASLGRATFLDQFSRPQLERAIAFTAARAATD